MFLPGGLPPGMNFASGVGGGSFLVVHYFEPKIGQICDGNPGSALTNQHSFWVHRWKAKCKKLERDADRAQHSAQQTAERNEQLVKETESLRAQLTSGGHQVEALKRELGELLAWRAQADESVSRRDSEVRVCSVCA